MVKAKETNLEGVLEGKKQYQVPLYQRVYSWGSRQLNQLWDDVVEIAETRKEDPTATHFIGSLVLASSPDNAAVGVQKFLVVDGQQRLTTLTLLLAALRDHLVETEDSRHRDRIDAQFLVNRYEEGEPAKVLPTQADRSAYLAVIEGSAQAGGLDTVGDAYRRFRSKIAAFDDPDDPLDLTGVENAVLRGLAVVAVTAEPGDNAHRIFESLNNTGLKLTQADLLKNYLFMRLGHRAEPVYNGVWLPLEKRLDSENLELLFWLDLVQTDEKAKQSDTYVGQQKRLERLTAPEEIEAEIRRIAVLGDVLAAILAPGRENDDRIRRRLERIKAWGSTTSYPVVMQILARRAAGTANVEQVVRALTYLESYFVRRIVIGRATAGLNRSLLQAVAAISDAPEIDIALRSYLSTGRKHFATDDQVRAAVGTVAFYWQGRGPQKKLILQWLEESYGSKEAVDPTNLTVEHVLPQTLTDEVREDFADGLDENADITYEHERIVHTLGNLTLTGYNSELSNRPFDDKRTMLAASGLRLNQEIAERETWGIAQIEARGAALAEKIIQMWPGPDETIRTDTEEPSALRSTVAAIVAEIPPGRWTSYGEVALVAGTYPQPLAAILSTYPIPNAWRVLQAGGTISQGFRWTEPDRDDDPRVVLETEGLRFDDEGRALPQLFIHARELADLAGFEVDEGALARRQKRTQNPASTSGPSTLQLQQLRFWERVRGYGQQHAQHISRWQKARPQHWHDIAIGGRAYISMTTNSQKKLVGVDLTIPDDKALFAALHAKRAEIEGALGVELDWRPLPNKKASRIIVRREGDFLNEEDGSEIIPWLIRTADDFARVFPSYL